MFTTNLVAQVTSPTTRGDQVPGRPEKRQSSRGKFVVVPANTGPSSVVVGGILTSRRQRRPLYRFQVSSGALWFFLSNGQPLTLTLILLAAPRGGGNSFPGMRFLGLSQRTVRRHVVTCLDLLGPSLMQYRKQLSFPGMRKSPIRPSVGLRG